MKIDDDVMQASEGAVNEAIRSDETGLAVKMTIRPAVFYYPVARAIQSERDRNRAEMEAQLAENTKRGWEWFNSWQRLWDLMIEGGHSLSEAINDPPEQIMELIDRLTRERDEERAEIERLTSLNAILMGDDEDKPRYTTKRLKLEIANATEALTRERDEARALVERVIEERDDAKAEIIMAHEAIEPMGDDMKLPGSDLPLHERVKALVVERYEALATARLEGKRVGRNAALKGLSVTKKAVAAAQGAYEHEYEYGLTDQDMKKAIQAALKALSEGMKTLKGGAE